MRGKEDEALIALLAARVEIMDLLAAQGKRAEAMAELDSIAAIELPPGAEEIAESMVSVYVDGVERLVGWGELARAERLARGGLGRFGASELGRGHLLMALGRVQGAQGRGDEAVATLREAAALFERLRAARAGRD